MAQEKAAALRIPPSSTGGTSLRGSFYTIGLVGLAIAVASIADMFSPRPSDGIVPVPYGHGGIEGREVLPGGPAETPGIRTGDRVIGIGHRLVRSASDASAELQRHRIGETVPYLIYREGELSNAVP